MNLRRAFAFAVFGGFTLGARLAATEAPPLTPYQPPANLTSTLRLGGSRHLTELAKAWVRAYEDQHPGVKFEIKLLGNGTAMPALYLGLADVVFFGRDPIVTDRDGFAHVMKYDPLGLELATGSLATPGKSPALVLLVHRDNPLAQLNLDQVDAIFSDSHVGAAGTDWRVGEPAHSSVWGRHAEHGGFVL
jgi:phosphate transport system substrate-binding protein